MRAFQVFCEGTADGLDILPSLCAIRSLFHLQRSFLIRFVTHLVLGLDFLHARGVLQEFVLIRAVVAEFHDGLVGAGVERVEVLPLFLLHAIDGVLGDAFHTGLEIGAQFVELLLFRHDETQVVAADFLKGPGAPHQLLVSALFTSAASEQGIQGGHKQRDPGQLILHRCFHVLAHSR